LKIKARIEDTCRDGWIDYQLKNKITAVRGKKANLYVRFIEDQCTLSLDTSGERLHKRGSRQMIGEAPLRETIAAAMIRMLAKHHEDGPIEVVDPMMGAGTFLLEAATRDRLVDAREFGFDVFAVKPKQTPQLKVKRPQINNLIGYELDANTLKAAQANLKSVAKDFSLTLFKQDFFKAEPLAGPVISRWLLANPPYGERLKVKEPLLDFYVRLFAAADRVAKPDRACFLLPSKAVKGRFLLPGGWKVLEKRPFLNGGIPVVAFVFGRSR
jgi:putative N6-adenine-specific DNA methylase